MDGVRHLGRITGIGSTTALLAALAIPASADGLSGEIANARGQALGVMLAGQDTPDVLHPAVVENNGEPRLVATHELDLGPLDELGLLIGTANLVGEPGVLTLGALNQYAEASGEGFSYAAAGAVSDAGLIDPPDMPLPEESGVQLAIGTDAIGLDDLISLQIDIGVLASTAHWPAGGPPEASFALSDVSIHLAGSLIDDVAAELDAAVSPVADQLATLGGLLGVDTAIENPLADGTLVVSEDQLREAAGVDALTELPAGTDLLGFLVDAVVAELTEAVDAVVTEVSAAVDALRDSPQFGTVCNPPLLPPNPLCAVLDTAVTTVADAAATALESVMETVLPMLDEAVSGLLALIVGMVSEGDEGSLTITALTAVVQPDEPSAVLDLAASTVGPNITPNDDRSSAP